MQRIELDYVLTIKVPVSGCDPEGGQEAIDKLVELKEKLPRFLDLEPEEFTATLGPDLANARFKDCNETPTE